MTHRCLLTQSIELYEIIVLNYALNMYGLLHMILHLENRDLSFLDIYPFEAIFLFIAFTLKVSETINLFDYFALMNKPYTILSS